jgi:hypothetical protein
VDPHHSAAHSHLQIFQITILDSRKESWEVIDHYCVKVMGEGILDSESDAKKNGSVPSELNQNMGFDMYKSGIGLKRTPKLAGYGGIHAMSDQGLWNKNCLNCRS